MTDRTSAGAGPFAELIAGRGFYKLGYVTSDREAALEQLQQEYGVTEFARFDPELTVSAEGTSGTARLQCAFSVGLDPVIEVMQPVDGLVALFRNQINSAKSLTFHHVGVLVDDMDAALSTATAAGTDVVWSADLANGMRVAYLDVPLLGHALELVSYAGESGNFLKSVRAVRS